MKIINLSKILGSLSLLSTITAHGIDIKLVEIYNIDIKKGIYEEPSINLEIQSNEGSENINLSGTDSIKISNPGSFRKWSNLKLMEIPADVLSYKSDPLIISIKATKGTVLKSNIYDKKPTSLLAGSIDLSKIKATLKNNQSFYWEIESDQLKMTLKIEPSAEDIKALHEKK